MFGLFENKSTICRGPGLDIFDVFRTVDTVIEYATSDQEKEGREKGINVAAAIYAPVLRDLEERQKEIIAETDKKQQDFESQANLLKKQCEYYENGIDYYKRKIAELAETTPGADNFFDAVNRHGMFSEASSARAFSSAICYYWSIADSLKKKMDEKREKYFKIEFEKQSLVWQNKIKSVHQKIVELMKEFKYATNETIKKISHIVDDAMEEYSEVLAEYNALKEMRK